MRLLRELARIRAESEPPLLRRSMQHAFLRRWWSLLSVALHDSIAAALDPSLDVAEGLFPVADAIDVWTRDRWKRKQAFSERLYISCIFLYIFCMFYVYFSGSK